MKYAFFAGCLIPAREPQYENSVKKIAPRLGIELERWKEQIAAHLSVYNPWTIQVGLPWQLETSAKLKRWDSTL